MSSGVDLSQFFDTFFDEADELLADMETILLELDLDDPDVDKLNGIFRAAHSIKGGAGTFGCFGHLADTTHLLENILDLVRNGEMALRTDMIDLFLETKDVLSDQVAAYREGLEPDEEAYQRICEQLKALASEHQNMPNAVVSSEPKEPTPKPVTKQPEKEPSASEALPLCLRIVRSNAKDIQALRDEMALMGDVLYENHTDTELTVWLHTTASPDDIEAVCCFVVNDDQISVQYEALPRLDGGSSDDALLMADEELDAASNEPLEQNDAEAVQNVDATPTEQPESAPSKEAKVADTESDKPTAKAQRKTSSSRSESSSIRVGVERVDQIINLVGELVITQAMLVQTASNLDPVVHDRLLNGIEQLERNARDLQESVMSIRMMPMDYVFSRFPRVVRENAARLGKQIRLVTKGQSTELDKSLIERIIDPLTHLVRNSIDHGIELPEKRQAVGKAPEGTLTLSAQHQGGHIVLEISDDGGGLNREKILKKALAQNLTTNENISDDELWQLLFAPGFSTAEQVTDISGRGVGMDVVRRNIQSMGGNVQMFSREGQGTTTRIVLPLTLAILDGMSVQVGNETFILPLSHVTESMQPTTEQIKRLSNDDHVLHVRGEYLPVISLADVFSVENAETDMTKAIAVILQAEDMRFALLVDHLIGQHQVVVKNLEANYRKIPGISAATILGDGSVALIVDVFALHRLTRARAEI